MLNFHNKHVQPEIKEKVHILTLDNRWHELFEGKKTRLMKEQEKKLTNLLKKQGEYNTEHKEYTLLKKKVMSDILGGISETMDEKQSKEMDKNKRYIEDINKKLENLEIALAKLPELIDTTNSKLLDASMSTCYNRMKKRKKILDGMDERIEKMRNELKELIGEKTESKEEYENLYSYMHDLVGSDIMEEFDAVYLGGSNND